MIGIARRRTSTIAEESSDGRGIIDDYEYVDLGLPSGLKWATCNVGAYTETEYGDYYMYGKGSSTYYPSDNTYLGTENPLASSADTATQDMGSGWRMPTKNEINELINNTTYSFVTINGVSGGKFTSKSNPNAYVFFPAAGYYDSDYEDDSPLYEGDYGDYWSSTPKNSVYSYALSIWSRNGVVIDSYRGNGLSVRGVHE